MHDWGLLLGETDLETVHFLPNKVTYDIPQGR